MITTLKGILSVLLISAFGLTLGLILSGIDRILVARMQSRIGPRWNQPFWDILKLLKKQNSVPEGAIPSVFNGAPVVALAGALSLLLYLPLGGMPACLAHHGDAILVLYLLLIPGLAMVIGGLASGSPYAIIGAQREMVTMLSYEFPLAAIIVTWAWKLSSLGVSDPFSFTAISINPIWSTVGPLGAIGVTLMLFIMLLVMPGELGRIPFDAPEAETELAGGLLVEYAGRNLALFQLAIAVKTVAMGAWMVILFAPWNLSQLLPLPALLAWPLDLLFFILKMGIFLFIGMTLIRASMARFRITQIVNIYWMILGVLSILALTLIVLDARWT